MDKYQENALRNVLFYCVNDEEKKAEVVINDGKLVVNQNEDYNIVNYDLIISGEGIEKIEFFKDKWIDSTAYESKINENNLKKVLPISFDGGTEKIRITFVGDLVDPVELPIEYIGADKATWDRKHKEEIMAEYAKGLSLCETEGTTFFKTLFFQPCSPICKKVVVEWYAVCKANISEKNKPSYTIKKTYFLGKDEITEGRCFSNSPSIAICQVYHDSYVITGGGSSRRNEILENSIKWKYDEIAYVIKQYDANGNLLIEASSENMPKKLN